MRRPSINGKAFSQWAEGSTRLGFITLALLLPNAEVPASELDPTRYRSAIDAGTYNCLADHDQLREQAPSLLFNHLTAVRERTGTYIAILKSLAAINALLGKQVNVVVTSSEEYKTNLVFVLDDIHSEIFIGNHNSFENLSLGRSSPYLVLMTLAHEFGHIMQNESAKNWQRDDPFIELHADVIGAFIVRRLVEKGFVLNYYGRGQDFSIDENGLQEYACANRIVDLQPDLNLKTMTATLRQKYAQEIVRLDSLKSTQSIDGPSLSYACIGAEAVPTGASIANIGALWRDGAAIGSGARHGTYHQRYAALIRGWNLGGTEDFKKILMRAGEIADEIAD